MNKEISCYRCGKKQTLTYKTLAESIHCDHCHSSMRLSDKSNRRYKAVRYAFVFIVCLVLAFGISMFEKRNYVVLMLVFVATMALATFSDHLCLGLTWLMFGLEYEEDHPEERAKLRKQQEKQEEKEKARRKAARAGKKARKEK